MATNYNFSIVRNGLVLYLDAANSKSYPGSGTTWTDISRNGNNGTLTNGPTYNSANGGSIVFDGTNDHIILPSGFSNFTSGFTIFCVLNFGSANIWERIIDFGNGGPSNNILFARNSTSNTLTFELYGNGSPGSSFGKCDATNCILNNTTAQYAATLDGVNCVIYRNGAVFQSFSYPYFPVNINRTSNFIAKSNWVADAHFQSSINNILIYNRALSPTEILQNYNATKKRFGL